MVRGKWRLAGPVNTDLDFDDQVPVRDVTLFWGVTGGNKERTTRETSNGNIFASTS